jgi:hypothetical protein
VPPNVQASCYRCRQTRNRDTPRPVRHVTDVTDVTDLRRESQGPTAEPRSFDNLLSHRRCVVRPAPPSYSQGSRRACVGSPVQACQPLYVPNTFRKCGPSCQRRRILPGQWHSPSCTASAFLNRVSEVRILSGAPSFTGRSQAPTSGNAGRGLNLCVRLCPVIYDRLRPSVPNAFRRSRHVPHHVSPYRRPAEIRSRAAVSRP